MRERTRPMSPTAEPEPTETAAKRTAAKATARIPATDPAPTADASGAAVPAPAETPTVDTAATPATETADVAADGTAEGAGGETADGEPEKRRRGRPKGSTAKTTRTIELILTVSGTVDGDWQAELKQGSTWLSRGLTISSTAVSRAARELHPELAEPIDTAIGAAREQRAARVAALEAELEQARKALAELEG
jgi:hypothetical protein